MSSKQKQFFLTNTSRNKCNTSLRILFSLGVILAGYFGKVLMNEKAECEKIRQHEVEKNSAVT